MIACSMSLAFWVRRCIRSATIFAATYHSWQTQVTKRMSRGFTVLGSYTLGKSIDSSSTNNLGATVSNPFDLQYGKRTLVLGPPACVRRFLALGASCALFEQAGK